MGKLRTFLALPGRERLAFLEAWAWVCASKAGLCLFGLSRMLRLFRRADASRTTALPHAVRWLPVAARYCPGGASCLVRSLGLFGILHRGGIPADLRIGVGNTRPALQAHSWVEVDGVPVNDSADVASRYQAFTGPLSRARAAP